MTILTINKKQFEKDIGKFDEKIQDRIAMFGTPIEAIRDEEIDIEIFPNRPDLLSYQNYKNSFLAFLGKNTGLNKIKLNAPEKDYSVKVDKSVENIRPYTACAIVKGLKLDDEKIREIINIQEKLHLTIGRKRKKLAIGIYPLEQISLPIIFKAMTPEEIKFQPLEFPSAINGKQILSKHPAGREYGDLLKGYEKYPVFVDSNEEILSMPPIINSHKTGKITENTEGVFIEVSGFDFNILQKTLNIIVVALSSIGGKIYQIELNIKGKKILSPDLSPEKMKLNIENTNKLLGLELKEKDIKGYLERMGYDYSNGIVSVPVYRTDILHEVDLIEDIAIAYGYEKFEPEIPEVSTIGQADKNEIIKSKMAEILTGLNFLETSSYHLTTKNGQIKKMGLKNEEFSEIKESKTEYDLLRKDLTHYILKILGENVDVEYPQDIFQIGKIFENYNEKDSLAIASAPGNFTKLKQILEHFAKMLGMEFEICTTKEFPAWFIDGRVGEIKFNNEKIGFLGEVNPIVLDNFGLQVPVCALEIEIENLLTN